MPFQSKHIIEDTQDDIISYLNEYTPSNISSDIKNVLNKYKGVVLTERVITKILNDLKR